MKKNTNKTEVVKVSSRILNYVKAIGDAIVQAVSAKEAILKACKGLKGEEDYKAIRPALVSFLQAKGISDNTAKGYCCLVREACGIAKQNQGNKKPAKRESKNPEKQAMRKAIEETEKMLSAKQAGTVAHSEEDTVQSATNKMLNILTTLKEGELVQVLAQIGMNRLLPLIHAMNEFVGNKAGTKKSKKQ